MGEISLDTVSMSSPEIGEHDTEYDLCEEDDEDETTINEQEEFEGKVDHSDELKTLQEEGKQMQCVYMCIQRSM